MSKDYFNNRKTVKDENSMIEKSNRGTTPIPFRWLFGTIIFILSIRYLKISIDYFLIGMIVIAFIYNLFTSVFISKNRKTGKNASIVIMYFDILFISIFSYLLGGINSDLFVMFLFIIGYCSIYNNVTITLKTGLFCTIIYSVSCIAVPGFGSDSFNYIMLAIRDTLFVMAMFGATRVNNEVKRYYDLHKKEFKMASTDRLTGLANRHYLDQKLKYETEYVENTGNVISLLMFDLDNFKNFNDSYGHVWGDKLLTLFSDIIKQNIRKCDTPVRYGGEEFLIIIRDLDINSAKCVADRIRKQLEKQHIYTGDGQYRKKVTVSCGVAQYPLHSHDIKEVIDLADKALYHVKENGKNATATYDELIKDHAQNLSGI